MNNKPIIVIGYGGHAKVVIDVLQLCGANILGVTDPKHELLGDKKNGIIVLGDDSLIYRYSPTEILLINGLGSVGSAIERQKVYERFKQSGYVFCRLIHPSATVANDVVYGEGCQIMAGAVIQTGVVLGCNSVINTKAAIDHDCNIGDHVHIAPGVTISGGVRIGAGAHVGTGACIIQGIEIGAGAVVGAGAAVIGNVAAGSTVVGVPAKVVKS